MRTRLCSALAAGLALAAAPLLSACDDDPVRPPAAAELGRAKAATSRYRNVDQAVADGYVDAHIVMQNMGHHYLKASLLDDRFEPERPELLVYAPDAGGRMRLVAMEYAVPLDKSVGAPAGFAGRDDSWDRNTRYGLWTLHAWLWRDNPAGVFAPRNARVELDPGTLEGDRMPGMD